LNVWAEYAGSSYDIFGNLDINIIGIDEQEAHRVKTPIYETRIIAGPLNLPAGINARIYDISGRKINAAEMAPGIYYLETDGEFSTRIIKIK
jgi:hypothetical protein